MTPQEILTLAKEKFGSDLAICRASGVCRTSINQIRAGSNPRWETVTKLAKAVCP